MKEQRQALIRRLVRSGRMATQSELRRALRAHGRAVDQSTLSRDLAELGIRKSGGRYVEVEAAPPRPARLDLSGAVRSFRPCGPHLIVVRTETGQAQPVAVSIDRAPDASVVATLAGDDTIFVATANGRTQRVALRRLAAWFGDKHE